MAAVYWVVNRIGMTMDYTGEKLREYQSARQLTMRPCMICGGAGKATEVYQAAQKAPVVRACKPCLAKIMAAPQPADAPPDKKNRLRPIKCKACHDAIAARIMNRDNRRLELCDSCWSILDKDAAAKESGASRRKARLKLMRETKGCKREAGFIVDSVDIQILAYKEWWGTNHAALQPIREAQTGFGRRG